MKPFLSVFHAKAHDFKCEVGELCYVIIKTEHLQMNVKTFSALLLLLLLLFCIIPNQVKCSGAYQDGAGLNTGGGGGTV